MRILSKKSIATYTLILANYYARIEYGTCATNFEGSSPSIFPLRLDSALYHEPDQIISEYHADNIKNKLAGKFKFLRDAVHDNLRQIVENIKSVAILNTELFPSPDILELLENNIKECK